MLETDCEPNQGNADEKAGPMLVTMKSIDLRKMTPKNVPVIEPIPPTIIKPMYHMDSVNVNWPVDTEP